MQFFGINTENIPSVQKASSTSLTWANTNNGTATVVRVSGQAYSPSSTITLNTGTVGFNGIDVGSLAANTLYYIYAVVSSNVMGMIISLAGPSTGPAGFTSNFRLLGKLRTDFGGANINTVAMDASIVPLTAIGTPINYTPTLNAAWGTGPSIFESSYTQIGDRYYIRGTIQPGSSPTGSALSVSLPNSHSSTNTQPLTAGVATSGLGVDVTRAVIVPALSTTFGFNQNTNWSLNQLSGTNAAGGPVYYSFSVTVRELAGLYT